VPLLLLLLPLLLLPLLLLLLPLPLLLLPLPLLPSGRISKTCAWSVRLLLLPPTMGTGLAAGGFRQPGGPGGTATCTRGSGCWHCCCWCC
jgi:hypothetical protein